ncbi:MAG: cobalamin biosynthesis protein CobD [Rhodovulum sulfidophilum]|uniref:Cobalamin biosynthesis protein CobD n=1 Tax=Rhodovulum sulfidophilum TaxID=35806 RepID=A0A2W5PVV8_RHOSU|nr:MAG: cobalamin biosynthesis protein CobD [Rhodovulum sulfidophilum]
MFAAAMILGLAIDLALGWPDALFRRIGHPVTWIGRLIAALEARWNRGGRWRRRSAGLACALLVIAAAVLPAALLAAALPGGWAGALLTGVLAWPLIAARSLHDHVAAVAAPLARGDLAGARVAVARIVGRDPAMLDAAGVARAAIESLAENASDGVAAPLFWGALLGLPGIAGYKAVNTLDSMIGHRNARYEDFGKAAARIDDLANLIPARLTGLLFALVSRRPRPSLAAVRRDARLHRSPNAGWPEAAMAGGLGIRLSGPRVYGDRRVEEPWVNGAARDPEPADIRAALALAARGLAAGAALLAITALWL